MGLDMIEEQTKKDNDDYVVFDEYPFFFNAMGIINGDRNTLVLVTFHYVPGLVLTWITLYKFYSNAIQ